MKPANIYRIISCDFIDSLLFGVALLKVEAKHSLNAMSGIDAPIELIPE
jgi:hypothetical protein